MKNNNILATIILLVWVLIATILIIMVMIAKENVDMQPIVTQSVRVYAGFSAGIGGYIYYLKYGKKK